MSNVTYVGPILNRENLKLLIIELYDNYLNNGYDVTTENGLAVKFNMKDYVSFNRFPCKTAACIAGHAAILSLSTEKEIGFEETIESFYELLDTGHLVVEKAYDFLIAEAHRNTAKVMRLFSHLFVPYIFQIKEDLEFITDPVCYPFSDDNEGFEAAYIHRWAVMTLVYMLITGNVSWGMAYNRYESQINDEEVFMNFMNSFK